MKSILTALKTAALSGIDVQIMLPGISDSTIVYWSSLSYVSELLLRQELRFIFTGMALTIQS